jgi:hypothetical protein
MLQRLFSYLESLIPWDIFPPLKIPRAWILWGTIFFFLLLILLTLRRHILKREGSEEDDLADLDQPDLFTLLRSALRRALDELIRQMDGLFGIEQARRLLAAARIRRIYARLLKLSARLGTLRPASRTPLEFLPNLQALFPSMTVELDTITQAYLRVRYGELPETVEEVQMVEHAWGRVFAESKAKLKLSRRSSRN